MTDDLIRDFVARVRQFSTLIVDVVHSLTLSRDPKDEKYLDLALLADAEFIVTRDKDLLALTDSADADAIEIRRQLPRVNFIDPVDFLRLLRSRDQGSGSVASSGE